MSSLNIESITIPPDLEAEMTPAVRAFVKMLLDRIGKLEDRVEELERGRKTPQNSSLPPIEGFVCPAAADETQVEEETWRAARPRETRATFDSHRPMRRCATAETGRMPTLRSEALGR